MADVEERKVIVDINVLSDESVKNVVELTTQLDKLKKEQKALDKTTEEGRIQNEKYNVAITATKKAINEQNKETQKSIKVNNAAEGSYDKLSAQYDINKKALNAMSEAERKTTASGIALEKETADIYEEMKRLQEATGKNVLSVGDYAKANRSLNQELADTPGALGNVVTGANEANAAFKKLIANPIVLVVTLLVSALVGLVSLFKKTKSGAEAFAVAGAIVDGILSAMVGVVDKLAKGLKTLFENPVDSLKSFGQAVIDNVVNRFKAVIDLGGALGKALSSLVKGDMKGLKDAASEAGTALVQMNTGLDSDQQAKFAKSVRDTTNAVIDQAAAFGKLEEQRTATRTSNRELAKSLEELKTQQQEFSIIAEDDTRGWEEREKAAKSFLSVTAQISQKELKIAKDNLSIINQEIALRSANGEQIEDLRDQQLAAFQALADADRSYRTTRADRAEKDAKRERDLIEKTLDSLQKDLESRRSILLARTTDETLSFKERSKNISALRNLQDSSFADQLAEIQKLTKVQINANDLLKASNSQLLLEQIRELKLSEIGEQRLIEIVADRKTAVNDLTVSYKELATSQTDGVKELLRLNINEQIEEVTKRYKDVIAGLNETEKPVQGDTSDEAYKLSLEKYNAYMLEKGLIANRLEKQLVEDVAAIQKEATDNATALKEKTDAEQIAKDREKYDEMADVISEWGNIAMSAFSALSGLQDAINERELANLEERYNREAELLDEKLASGAISQERYDSEMADLDKDLAKEQAKIAREQAIREKTMAMFEIAINTAAAIVKSLPNIPLAIAVGALGAVQLAAVAAQPLPKAEKGMYIQGASHANGGVAIEAEGGEVIMTKGAVGLFGPTLSAMNVAGGGIPFNIPDGGYSVRNTYGSSELSAINSQLDAIINKKIFVTVEAYSKVEQEYANVVAAGGL